MRRESSRTGTRVVAPLIRCRSSIRAGEVTGGPCLPDPADGDRVGVERPAPDVVLGGCGVAARADPDEAEALTAEGDSLVVVPLVTLERDVDDGLRLAWSHGYRAFSLANGASSAR